MTLAYRLLGLSLLISYTLIGLLPVSVFAQAEDVSIETDLEATIETGEVVVIEDEEVGAEDEMAAVAAAPTEQYADTYRKEWLPNRELVFYDFEVGPGRFVFDLSPGESRTVELVIANRMGSRQLFSFTTEDAEGSDDTSGAVSLTGQREGPYTIRDFISVPHERFYLEQGQQARVPVTVSLPADAEPGGRYGSILTQIVSQRAETDDISGARPGTTIVSRIGTLFFVTTPGDIDREGHLEEFSTVNDRRLYGEGPIPFTLLFNNTGTVHLNPYGEIRITNILGDEIGNVPLQPWFVMPQSMRLREVAWERDFLVGRYVATAYINRGYGDIVDEMTYTFWVIPWKIILTAFGGLFVFFLLLRLFFSRFEFKRKT